MPSLRICVQDAEKVRRFLIDHELYDNNYKTKKDGGYLVFPVTSITEKLPRNIIYEWVDCEHEKSKDTQSYQEKLRNKIPPDRIALLPSSFEIVGDIIIIDIQKELMESEKEIGSALLSVNKNVNTVLKKTGIHEGEFRTQKLVCIAGVDKKETIHKENNIRLKLDVQEVYFSARSSSERKRIYQLVKPNETILVMFSGCAPFPLVISRNTGAKEITGIEKNPIGHRYGLENLILNKCKNVRLLLGDVRDIVPHLNAKFDRIVMPLPKDADIFLDTAFIASKKGTIIHLYDFEHETEIDKAWQKAEHMSRKCNIPIEHLRTVKCGQYSPGKFRLCVDFLVK